MNIVNKENAEHYMWGNNCEGWRIVNSEEMTIIFEKMPPGTSEKMHFHEISRQFFFIIRGKASIETDEQTYTLEKNEGIEILPGIRHRFYNPSENTVEFLVTSFPSAIKDRTETAKP